MRRIKYPKMFFVMSDGIADDLYPPADRLLGLVKPMPEVMAAEYPDQVLAKLISYKRLGSNGDRTLVVIRTSFPPASPLRP